MTAGILMPPRGLLIPPREIVLPNPRRMLSVIGRALGFMGGPAGPVDPNFSSVVLLCHLDGSDGGTTFTDDGPNNETATNSGADTATGTKKYGTASLRLDSQFDYISFPLTNIAFGNGDFTIEGWMNYPTISASNFGQLMNTGTSATNFILSCGSSGLGGTDDKLNYWTTSGVVVSTSTVTGGAWHHFAITRSGTTLRLFVDGTLEATGTDAQNHGGSAINLGYQYHRIDATSYLDDVRITKGVCRYTATFTAPTEAYPDQ